MNTSPRAVGTVYQSQAHRVKCQATQRLRFAATPEQAARLPDVVRAKLGKWRLVSDRFWLHVDFNGAGGCWLWTKKKFRTGYGSYSLTNVPHGAHRIAYIEIVGAVAPGLQLDHLCRVRHCLNPSHLEPVTPHENVRRGESPAARNMAATHCLRGHAFDDANTRQVGPKRWCRKCDCIRRREYRKRAI